MYFKYFTFIRFLISFEKSVGFFFGIITLKNTIIFLKNHSLWLNFWGFTKYVLPLYNYFIKCDSVPSKCVVWCVRCQGACVAAIQPEYLMPPADFLLWRQLQKSIKFELLRQGNTKDAAKIRADDDIEEEMFEAISKRTWTDVLLQILKVRLKCCR